MRSEELMDLLECFEPEDLSECALYRNALEKTKELFDKKDKIISKLQKELDKKNNVINLMAQERAEICETRVSKEAIIDFYFKKVEGENE